jgi:hypothetical protein
VTAQLGLRRYIGGLLGVCVQSEVFWHLPDEDLAIVNPRRSSLYAVTYLAIVRGRRNQRVVEGTPMEVFSAAPLLSIS